MKTNRAIHAVLVLIFWGGIAAFLYSLGAFILSHGWFWIDSSPYRDFLYTVEFYLLPAVILIGLIHFFCCILTARIAIRSAIVAFFAGLAGDFVLLVMILVSGGDAIMALIGWLIYFCLFAGGGFILATLVQIIWNALSKKPKA